ncbi:MAG: hypothetical protein IJW82_04385 [Clostridia bacterium]|nr:hypothetical protein [Clostridia bacterium]
MGVKKLTLEEYQINTDKHCIKQRTEQLPYKSTYAWIISDSKRYEKPIPYKHPMDAVIWVNID